MAFSKFKGTLRRQNFRAFVIILLVLLTAYSVPYLIGRGINPLLQRSGLAVKHDPGIVGGQNSIDPNDGFTSQALGHKAAESWLSGEVPYWNHYEGIGVPLAGEMQSAAFFPMVLLMYLPSGIVLFHFLLQLIAGFAAYLFLRRINISYVAALVGGIAFALNGTYAWLGNAVVNPIAFLPLLMLGVETAYRAVLNRKPKGWLLIAVAIALSLYSGFPETAFINALLAAGWGLVRLFSLQSKDYKREYFIKLLKGAVVGLLLSAPVLIAFVGYLPYAEIGGHSEEFAETSLGSIALPPLVMPYIYGPIFGLDGFSATSDLTAFWSSVGGYFLASLLVLAIFGLYSNKLSKGLKIFLVAWVIIGLLKTFGVNYISDLVNLIPTIKNAAFYRYVPPSIYFALVILAALGIDAVKDKKISSKATILTTLPIIGLLGILALIAKKETLKFSNAPNYEIWAALSLLVALSIILLIAITNIIVKQQYKVLVISLIVVTESFVLFVVPFFSTPKVVIDTQPVKFLQGNIDLYRFYTLGPIAPNYGSYFEVASVNINDLPIPENYAEHIEKKLDSNVNPLVFTGYSRNDPNGPSALEEFGKNRAEFENLGVKFIVASRGQIGQDFFEDHSLKRVYQNATVEIFELPNPKKYYEASSNCDLLNEARNYVEVNCSGQGKLVRREMAMPGWQAMVNNKKAPIGTSHSIFQSIDIPSGKSRVSFSYAPPFITWGYIALLLGTAIAVYDYIDRARGILKSGARKTIYLFRTVKLK